MKTTTNHIGRIDILRAIAILGVFLYHAEFCFFPNFELKSYGRDGFLEINNILSIWLNFNPISFGWTGVNLFLIISGFLIHLSFLKNSDSFNVKSFYLKRFWRIYPPYLLILVFFCVFKFGILSFVSKEGFLNLFSHLFFFNNALPGRFFFGINPSFWSLALEMQLYLLYPVLIFIWRIKGINFCFIISVLLSLFLLIFGHIFYLNRILAYETSVLKYWFIWISGALLAENFFQEKILFKKYSLVIIIVSFILTILSRLNEYSNLFIVYISTIAWLSFFEWFLNWKYIKINTLCFKILSIIGISSYSFYLIHQPFLENLFNFFSINLIGKYQFLSIIPVFLILFSISYSLYLFVEIPSINFGKQKNIKTLEKKFE